jgi:hypothetical protein
MKRLMIEYRIHLFNHCPSSNQLLAIVSSGYNLVFIILLYFLVHHWISSAFFALDLL